MYYLYEKYFKPITEQYYTNALSEMNSFLCREFTVLESGAGWEESGGISEPRRTALPRGLQSQVLW